MALQASAQFFLGQLETWLYVMNDPSTVFFICDQMASRDSDLIRSISFFAVSGRAASAGPHDCGIDLGILCACRNFVVWSQIADDSTRREAVSAAV